MAVERQKPPPSYYGFHVERRLTSPPKIPQAPDPDIYGRMDASPRQIEEVLFQTKKNK